MITYFGGTVLLPCAFAWEFVLCIGIVERSCRLSFSPQTDANFTIEWKGHYRIEGAAFIFVDRNTQATRIILGYPTQKLQHAAHAS
jgi:hypothetical protein